MFYKRIGLLFLAMVFALAGCYKTPPLYQQTVGNVADVAEKAKAAELKSDSAGDAVPAMVVNQGLYVDRTPINLARDPMWMRNRIVMRGEQLPFSYYSRTIVSGSGKNILTHYQVGLDQTVALSMNYSGTVKGALDLLAAKSGYVYTINGNTVYWQAFVTKTFDIAFMPGTADYTLGNSSDTAGSNSSSAGGGATGGLSGLASSSNLKGNASVWNDLDNTIKSLLSPDGKVIVSQSTTTVTVHDRPTNVQLIASYIKNLNKSLSRQVLVKIQVYEVTLSSDFNFGIDWQVVKRGFMGTNFVLNGNYGTPISITPLAGATSTLSRSGFQVPPAPFTAPPAGNPQFGIMNSDPTHITGINLLISALQQQGKVSVVSEPRVVALNNQVSVISIVDKQGYAASVSSSTIGGGVGSTTVTSTITPGTIITGLMLYILPKIMGDKIYLQVSADLSNQIGQPTNFSSGTSSIQIPHTAEKVFNQRSMIGSGDTLILSGFRQIRNTANATQLYNSQALGGKAATQINSETIVLITPILIEGKA